MVLLELLLADRKHPLWKYRRQLLHAFSTTPDQADWRGQEACVYLLFHADGSSYIGATVHRWQRKQEHFAAIRRQRHWSTRGQPRPTKEIEDAAKWGTHHLCFLPMEFGGERDVFKFEKQDIRRLQPNWNDRHGLGRRMLETLKGQRRAHSNMLACMTRPCLISLDYM